MTTVFTSTHATGAKQVSGAAAKIIRRIEMLEKILEGIERLHIRILKDKFAEKVTEQEIEALVAAKEIIKQHMNDGWIPVEEHPKKDYTAVFAVDKHDYYFVAVYDKEHGYRTNDVGADVDNIVAYCLFNPYRPERSE